MFTPKISVIVAVYNGHDVLRRCMDSILAQTLTDMEIICVDDDSRDDSLAILQEYAAADSRIQVIHQENGGAGAARNTGMQHATGEYLSILDCDDFFEPQMLENAYRAAKERDADIITFGCDFYDEKSDSFRPCYHSINRKALPDKEVFCAQDIKDDVFCLFVGWAWDKLFRREFIEKEKITFQVQRTTNDMLFVFNALIRAKRITVLDEVYAHYRQGVGSLSVTREKSWMCFYDALMALREELYKTNLYERFERDFKNYCIHFTLWNLRTLSEPTHTILYNKLRDEWFAEMGVLDCPKEYFYNKQEYAAFRSVYEHPVDWVNSKKAEAPIPASKLARGWHCLKTQGFRHTLKLILNKIKR